MAARGNSHSRLSAKEFFLAALAALLIAFAVAAEQAAGSHNAQACIDTPELCDFDDDGDPDFEDNCPEVANPGQEDADGDGTGDACEPDQDGDGVIDDNDNCPTTGNSGQQNNDGDGQGDACDPDDDNDGVPDGPDNCDTVPNGDQANLDGDPMGNACDPDDDNDGYHDAYDPHPNVYPDPDGDGIASSADNCPTMANGAQTNTDGDSYGDSCDVDDDNDGDRDMWWIKCNDFGCWYTGEDTCTAQSNERCYAWGTPYESNVAGAGGSPPDNCPTVPNPGQENLDGDAAGDACDPDDDNDGDPDSADNCPRVANADQANADDDSEGNACDTDADNDGAADGADNCRDTPNGGQANLDADGQGDACDLDDDNDGVADASDNCPRDPNASQTDVDGDGAGVACDANGDAPAGTNTTLTNTTTTAGSGDGGAAPAAESVAPVLGLTVAAAKLGVVLRRGLAATLTSNEVGTGTAELVLAGRVAKRLGLSKGKAVVVGSATLAVKAGKSVVTVKLGRKAKRAFAALRRVALTLRVTAKDAAGNTGKASKALTLRR